MIRSLIIALGAFTAFQGIAEGIPLDINDPESIKNAAATAAFNMMSYYHGNESGQVPGKLPGTWWTGGEMCMALVQYWYWTGDTSYNDVTRQALLWQKGHNDYLPDNYSQFLGNDDQVFWGLAAMTAAELNFPEEDDQPSWVSLAQGVFNTQVREWDTTNCHGGLRWQRVLLNGGYNLKNSVSNGGLFQLSSRLARYLKDNHTYAEWAEKVWDWSVSVPLIDNSTWSVYDTVSVNDQCKSPGRDQWSYNYGIYLSGAAYMYNLTTEHKWKDVADNLLNSTIRRFFKGKIMSEVACESKGAVECDGNQDTFKSLVSSWLVFVASIMPYTADAIMPLLQQSAIGAAKQCTGLADHKHCGQRWYLDTFDETTGMHEEMCALSIFSAIMEPFNDKHKEQGPLTADTGGTSKSDPTSGSDSQDPQDNHTAPRKIGTADRAGAAIITVVAAGSWIGMMLWVMKGD